MPQQDSTQPPMPGYPYYPPMGYDAEDEISLIDLWRVLAARKWMIFWLTTLFTVGGVGYALKAPNVYKAVAVLAPVKDGGGGGQMAALASQFGGLASLAGVNLGGGGGSTDQAIAILNSRKFINRFIAEEQLMPLLFEEQWDAEAKQWLVGGGDAEGGAISALQEGTAALLSMVKESLISLLSTKQSSVEQGADLNKGDQGIPSEWDAYNAFSSTVSTSADKKSGMVNLSVEWSDPELAAAWANKLVVRLNQHLKQEAVQQAETPSTPSKTRSSARSRGWGRFR